MRENGYINDSRVKRRYFYFPAYLAIVFAVAIFIMLPTIMYGGFHLIIENSSYYKWYFLWCVLMASIISLIFALYRYMSIDCYINKLRHAAKKVAEGNSSVRLPMRHSVDDMDYIDALFMDFNKMAEELGSMETLKNDFAANVSHEMKTPMSIISNYIQLLQKTELNSVQQEYVSSILESINRLASLIFNILKLNKLEAQKIYPKSQPYDLCRQLGDCAIGFESIWEQKNIEFEANMEHKVIIEADEELMNLVWNNLLSNAFKFTKPGGFVKINQFSDENLITVEVSDTGCGMSPRVVKHIFDKFYQDDEFRVTEGNGLGLSLVQRILQISGGTISVDSVEGEGTTFTVLLPKA